MDLVQHDHSGPGNPADGISGWLRYPLPVVAGVGTGFPALTQESPMELLQCENRFATEGGASCVVRRVDRAPLVEWLRCPEVRGRSASWEKGRRTRLHRNPSCRGHLSEPDIPLRGICTFCSSVFQVAAGGPRFSGRIHSRGRPSAGRWLGQGPSAPGRTGSANPADLPPSCGELLEGAQALQVAVQLADHAPPESVQPARLLVIAKGGRLDQALVPAPPPARGWAGQSRWRREHAAPQP